MVTKAHPVNAAYEVRVKNMLKGMLKSRGMTYAQLAEKLTEMGIPENERNLNNKISRGGFTAAFFLQCFDAMKVTNLRIDNDP